MARSAASAAEQKKGRPRQTHWQERFLEDFRLHGIQAWAANGVGVSCDTVQRECKRDPAFAARYEEAFEFSTAALERTALAWTSGGVTLKRTTTKTEADGSVTITVTEEPFMYPPMLIFLLKSRRPEVYRENLHVEQTGPGGGPVQYEQRVAAAVEQFGAEVVRLSDIRERRAAAD